MGQQQHTIAMQGLSRKDTVFFTSMLQIVHAKLEATWHLTEIVTDAEAVLVDLESTVGQDFWHNSPNCVKIAYAHQNTCEAEWFLPKPVRVQPLIQLFNALSTIGFSELTVIPESELKTGKQSKTSTSQIAQPINTQVSTKNTPLVPPSDSQSANTAAETTACFNPQIHLLGLLQNAVQQSHITELRCANLPPIYVSPQEQMAYTHRIDIRQLGSNHKILCSAYAEHVEQKVVELEALRTAISTENLQAYPFDTLLWVAALHASRGQLLIGLTYEQRFKLKRWPNFAYLPHQSIHMNLTAFMVKNPATINTITQKTYVPIMNIVNFINACHAINILEITPQIEQSPVAHKTISAPKRHLLQSILQKLMVSHNG